MVGGVSAQAPAVSNQERFETQEVQMMSDVTRQDQKTSSADPQFGRVWERIQGQYGAKGGEKPRVAKKTLDKDDFLKIMITQMRHQDPTDPMKADKFASELAQYSSVEQLQNLNQGLAKMAKQNQPLEQMAMTGLIGKTVTMDRERFSHVEGEEAPLSYSLPKDASKVQVTVMNEMGAPLFQKDLGEVKAGDGQFQWDGKQGNLLPAKTGLYRYRFDAFDEQGKKIETNPKKQVTVIGVSFEGTEPALLVGNPAKPDKLPLKNVSRIEMGQQSAVSTPAAVSRTTPPQLSAMASLPPLVQPNSGRSEGAVKSEKQDVKSTSSLSQNLPPVNEAKVSPEEMGFPHGLSIN